MAKDYYRRFGIDIGLEEAERRFVNRIYALVFRNLRRTVKTDRKVHEIKAAAVKIGEDHYGKPDIDNVVSQDYIKTQLAVIGIYNKSGASEERKREIDGGVKKALNEAEVDLGIKWENGRFYP